MTKTNNAEELRQTNAKLDQLIQSSESVYAELVSVKGYTKKNIEPMVTKIGDLMDIMEELRADVKELKAKVARLSS